MAATIVPFALLIIAFIMLHDTDGKVLPLRREAYPPAGNVGYQSRGYVPQRHRWFRNYARPYGTDQYDGYEGGYDNGRDGGYDNGYDRDRLDHNRENVKVNVKVYTADKGREHVD